MELRQLEYLVAVVDEASFTRAAARLHVAQPGVSAQIRQLERELGQELLDRTGRTVRPTSVGEAVLPYARAALDNVAAVRHAVEQLTGLVRGRVAIGTIPSRPLGELPGLLAAFHRAHPDVEITLTEDRSDRLLDAVRAGRLDLAVVGVAERRPAGVDGLVVTEQELGAAVPPGHPLAVHAEITLGALRDAPLACLPRGSGMRTALEAACATAGFRPRVAFEAGDPFMVGQLAADGLGIAILPAAFAAAHPGGLRPVALTSPRPRARIELVWRADAPTGPAARAFVAHARAAFAGPGEAPDRAG
ncbi:LysR family transcriptional regulator [Yinghuangia seranimata]|uniref:LysR family transcriptional regulator n=1 Tax=Yinghuangia seranimata TaxID=408067 RepID=UPI00248CBC1C|nr:LysR substrate-binding domain-containing protein [Yinghuangia seranimata]MDI2125562.1 LysR substrate-binding domain-containing protein [Yinghuangia seranimata]